MKIWKLVAAGIGLVIGVLAGAKAHGQTLRGPVTTTAYTRLLLTSNTAAAWRSALGVGITGTNVQPASAALTNLAANPALYQGTNSALTALAADPAMYQATNQALTRFIGNTYTNAALNPSSSTNFVVDFSIPSHTIQMTNAVNFQQSTGRSASATISAYTDVTLFNNSGSNLTVTYNDNWVAIGSTPITTVTNGKTLHVSFTNKRGTYETNVIYGVAYN